MKPISRQRRREDRDSGWTSTAEPIPGTNESGNIDAAALATWLAEVRCLCREYARADIGDHCLGQLLAKAPDGENGIWPCEAVCEAMEGTGPRRQ